MAAPPTTCFVMLFVLPPWIIGGSMAVLFWQEGFDGIGNTGVRFLAFMLQAFAALAGCAGLLIPLVGVCQQGFRMMRDKPELIHFCVVMASQCWCCVTCIEGVHKGTARWVLWWWPGAVVFWVTLFNMVARAIKEARRTDDLNLNVNLNFDLDMTTFLINNPQIA